MYLRNREILLCEGEMMRKQICSRDRSFALWPLTFVDR